MDKQNIDKYRVFAHEIFQNIIKEKNVDYLHNKGDILP